MVSKRAKALRFAMTELKTRMRRRFLLVHNTQAGLDGRRLVHEVTAGLVHLGASVATHTGPPEVIPQLLREKAGQLDAVIAAGGDGTIRALAAELQSHNLPLGVVPMGTGNVLSHEISLPRSAVGLVDLLLRGPVREIQGGRANGEPFFLMAGVGFDGEVIRRLDTPLKRRIGKAAYVKPVLHGLRTQTPALDLAIDGRPHQASWVVVANARRYGGAFLVAPEAGLERPGLVAVLLQRRGQLALVRQLMALGLGRLRDTRGVAMIPCQHVTVHSDHPVASQIDGDAFHATPLDITAGGASVQLIVPEAYAARMTHDDPAEQPSQRHGPE